VKAWRVAVVVVVAAWVAHWAYYLAPVGIEGHAWNVGQSLARVALLALVVSAWRSVLVDIPAAYMLAEEAQVIGCTIGFVINPWPILPGQSKCSEAMGLPIVTVCAVTLVWLCLWLLDKGKK